MPHYDATSLPRLMQCAASKTMPGFTTPGIQSDDQREGIAAHWLASEILRGRITDVTEWHDRKAPNGIHLHREIVEAVELYTNAVSSRPRQRRQIEQDMIWQPYDAPGLTIGCRPDMLSDDLADYGRRIYIDDFKYGRRAVEVDNNWTLIAHACAYISDKVIDHDTMFEFRIHQPRPMPIVRVWIISAITLMSLRTQLLAHLGTPSNTLQTGPYCYKCPARTNCPAIREHSMGLMDVVSDAIPDNMTLDDMSLMMDALSSADYSLKQYKEALSERIAHAISTGNSVRNYQLEKTEGRLEWCDGIDATALLMLAPDKPVVKPQEPITPTQAKKYIPEAVIKTLAERSSGGLKLVRRDATQLAQRLFGSNEQ